MHPSPVAMSVPRSELGDEQRAGGRLTWNCVSKVAALIRSVRRVEAIACFRYERVFPPAARVVHEDRNGSEHLLDFVEQCAGATGSERSASSGVRVFRRPRSPS